MTKREAKQAARATLTRVSSSIERRLSLVDGIRRKVEDRLGRIEVLIALDLYEGAVASITLEKVSKAIEYAATILPNESKATRYRWLNAGEVAYVLRGPAVLVDTVDEATGEPIKLETYPQDILGQVPNAHIGSLAHLYRILSAAKAGDADSRAKQESLLRETWTGILKGCEEDETEDEYGNVVEVLSAPDPADVLKAAEKVAPSNRSGGGGKAKADETEDEGGEDEGGDSTRGDSSNLVTVEAAKVEAAAGPVDSILRGLQRKADEGGVNVTEAQAKACMLAALRLAAEHGIGAVQAVLSGATVSTPETTPETTPEDEAKANAAAASSQDEAKASSEAKQ